jgi:uncharacterized delta-60 repeat protein
MKSMTKYSTLLFTAFIIVATADSVISQPHIFPSGRFDSTQAIVSGQDRAIEERFLPTRLRHIERMKHRSDRFDKLFKYDDMSGDNRRDADLDHSLNDQVNIPLDGRQPDLSREHEKINPHLSFKESASNISTLGDSVSEEWVRHYASCLIPSQDYACAIVVDNSGNIYVTGQSDSTSKCYDYLTIKYSSSGDIQWCARYNGPGNYNDYATALAVDASGNVYVTGYSYGSGTFGDYATIKYNASGVAQWVARYNGPANSRDEAIALAVDLSGNVYVTGYSWGTYDDYATIKYNASGVEQWVARYNGPGNSDDRATALAVDASGNVYVTGDSRGSGTSVDYATIKYNASGVEQWAVRYNGPGNSGDGATALAVDELGNVYVTGWSFNSSTPSDYATIKYNISGVEQWVARYNGPGNESDGANALAIDASGNVYVTGDSPGSGTSNDYATIKYNTSGIEQWVARYNGLGNSDDGATALAIDASGNVYVTGDSRGLRHIC